MKTMHPPLGRWLPDNNMPGTFIVLSAVFHFVSTLLHTFSTYIEPLHHAPHLQIALFTTPGNHHLEHRRYLPSSLLALHIGHLGHPHRHHYLPICLSYISVLAFSGNAMGAAFLHHCPSRSTCPACPAPPLATPCALRPSLLPNTCPR